VNADDGCLERILENLVSNAVKYGPHEEPIEVSAKELRSEVVVSVADHGPGVLAHEVKAMFENFYRSGRTSSLAPGLGVGLSVCRRLVESQNGRIWASNRPDGGLEVNFTLPLVQPQSEETASHSPRASSVAG
jgi:two-component system sensor histidine kinase KdpD